MNGLLESGLELAGGVPLVLVSAAIKGFIILSAAAVLCLMLRRASAAVRHLCWSIALVAALMLPLLAAVLPSISVGIVPVASETAVHGAVAPQPVHAAAAEDLPVPRKNEKLQSTSTSVFADAQSTIQPATWILIVWAAMALGILAHMAIGILGARRLIVRARPVTNRTWVDLVDEIGDRLFIRRDIRLLMNPHVSVPMTWGVFRPVIVLPSDAQDWSEDKRRCVLAHEMAHIKRLDCLTQSLATAACAVHWFNPIAWRAAKSMRLEREKACDDSVLNAARTKASDYASHLLDIAQRVPESFAAPSAVVTMASRSQLEGRVLSILDRDRRRSFRRVPAFAASILGTCAVLTLAAMEPAPASKPAVMAEVSDSVDAVDAHIHAMNSVDVHPEPEPHTASKPLPDPVDDVIKRSFDVSPDGWLEIDTDRGNIEVRSGNSNTVNVEVHRRVRGDTRVEDFAVEFDQDANTVQIVGEDQRDRVWGNDGLNVYFVVTVPKRFNLDIETAGGNVQIDDLEGVAEVRTAGGNLSFGRVSGSIEATTSGGNVSIDGSGGNVDVQTSGGNIQLGRVGGTVNVRTSGGNISVEEVSGEIEAVTSGGMIAARLARQPEGDSILKTSGGSITVYLANDISVDLEAKTSAGRVHSDVEVATEGKIRPDRLCGTINGGGPDLLLDTSAGDVHIKRL